LNGGTARSAFGHYTGDIIYAVLAVEQLLADR
jgi:cytochrome bd-type quinol oxidase subunit 1